MCWEQICYEILHYELKLLQIKTSTFSWTKYLKKHIYINKAKSGIFNIYYQLMLHYLIGTKILQIVFWAYYSLNSSDMIPGTKEIGGKASVASPNGAGGP